MHTATTKIHKKLLIFLVRNICLFIFYFFSFDGVCQENATQFEELEKYFVRQISDTLFSEVVKLNEHLSIGEKTASQQSIQHFNLWISPLDGKFEPVPLTFADQWDCFMPRWSKQSDQIVYISTKTGSKKLWLMQGNGTDKRQLTKGDTDDDFPLWSPDAAKIAFVRSNSLFCIDVKTEAEEQLTQHLSVLQPCAWSRDGNSILLICRWLNDKIKLMEFQLNDKQLIDVESQNRDSYKIFTDLRLHPAKNFVLFDKIKMGSYEVVVRNLRDGREIILSETYSADRNPDWSSKGNFIIFSSNRKIPKIEGLDK